MKVAATRLKMTRAMIEVIGTGEEPTIAGIMDVTGLSRNTCKRHFFAAYVAAIASVSVQVRVKGVTLFRQLFIRFRSFSGRLNRPIFQNLGSSSLTSWPGGPSSLGRRKPAGVPANDQRSAIHRLQA
jgi:hypothetical protein